MPAWHHKPTWPNEPRTHATDRMVLFGEDKVARITLIQGGPQDDLWEWAGVWSGPGHVGVEPSLEAALETVRRLYIDLMHDDPKRAFNAPPGSADYTGKIRDVPPRD